MTTPLYGSLIDDQITELPAHMALPADRVLMVFKGMTMLDALHEAELASIENPAAWTDRQFWCGEWTVSYQVRL
jgi:hypothetical protein